jgi:biotin carboxylase
MTELQEKELSNDIQRLLGLLNMRTSIYNIETRVGKNGKPYIMEVSPRGGGNRLAEMLRFATGVDMIENAVRASIGDEIIGIEQKPYNGHWAEIILHSEKEGKFERLEIEKGIKEKNLFQEDLWVEKGDKVNSFNGANDAIGTLVLKFETKEELEKALSNQDSWLKVICN